MNQAIMSWLRNRADRKRTSILAGAGVSRGLVDTRKHFDGCWQVHDDCALQLAADTIAQTEADRDKWRALAERRGHPYPLP